MLKIIGKVELLLWNIIWNIFFNLLWNKKFVNFTIFFFQRFDEILNIFLWLFDAIIIPLFHYHLKNYPPPHTIVWQTSLLFSIHLKKFKIFYTSDWWNSWFLLSQILAFFLTSPRTLFLSFLHHILLLIFPSYLNNEMLR